MSKTIIKSLYRDTQKYIRTRITVSGWVRTLRNSKEFGFIEMNDGSFLKGLQVVFELSLENFSEVQKISIGSSLEIVKLLNLKQKKLQLLIKRLKIILFKKRSTVSNF